MLCISDSTEDDKVLKRDSIKYVDDDGVEKYLPESDIGGELMVTDYLKSITNRHTKNLKVVHINAQSLNNDVHYSMFVNNFSESGIDIIAVSETFFKNSSKTVLPGYQVFNVNRTDSNGGGVALYIISGLKVKVLAVSNGLSTEPEFIILEVQSDSVTFLVSCVYRRPKNGYLENYLNDLYVHLPNYKYSIICGDFNARFGSGSFETGIIEEMFSLCNHIVLPFGPTYHVNECHSALDLIASNMSDFLIEYGKVGAPCFSHHDLLHAVFKIQMPSPVSRFITYRDYKNLDHVKLFEDIENIDWHSVHDAESIDDKVNAFNSILLEAFEQHVPLKRVKIRHYSAPWFTKDIHKCLSRRNKARKRYAKSGSTSDFETYRLLRNQTKTMIRAAKVKYYHNIFNASLDSEKLWKNIISLGIGKNCLNDSTKGFAVSANDLNKHYLNVSTVENDNLAQQTLDHYTNLPNKSGEPFHFKYVTSDDITAAVISITSNATGVDLIPVLFLKLVLSRVVYVIEYILNSSLQHGVFPSVWKYANVLPIPKVKNPKLCQDYRPISILCTLSKVFEKLVHSQIYNYVLTNNIINPLQSGFRKKHSTMTALAKVADDIRKNMDKREMTALVLLDFTKAFDRVNHDLLLIKLTKLGFSDSVILWLRSYLCGRYQRVFGGDDFLSDWAEVTAGVPQGSVLGPLLFILYLHDISSVIKHCCYHLYADDVQIYLGFDIKYIATAISMVNEDLERLVDFITKHNLALNVSKTQPIIIGTERYVKVLTECVIPNICISNTFVPYSNTVNNLGIILDTTLSWKAQVSKTVGSVFGMLAQVRRYLNYLPKSIRLRIVQSLIFPLIDYGSIIFTDMSKENCHKLQRAENACIRFICNVSKFEHITPRYAELQLLKIEDRRTLYIVTLMWNLFKYQCPRYLFSLFDTLSSIQYCSARTRASPHSLVIPVHRTVVYDKSFCVTASRIFNHFKIYEYLKFATPNSLKKDVRVYLQSQYV